MLEVIPLRMLATTTHFSPSRRVGTVSSDLWENTTVIRLLRLSTDDNHKISLATGVTLRGNSMGKGSRRESGLRQESLPFPVPSPCSNGS